MKLTHLSASRIKTFYQCQMQYHAKYDLDIADDYTHPLTIMGKAFHHVFEDATNARIQNMEGQDPFQLIDGAMLEYGVESKFRSLLVDLTQNAIDWGYFRKVEYTHGVEVEFRELLPDETPVVGYIDRLDFLTETTADIIDLKTQKRKFTEQQLDENWQADIYNWAARKKYPQITDDVWVSFWVVRHQVQRVVRTADDAKRTEERMLVVADEIRACEDPTISPSMLCNWCLYKNECPAGSENVKQRLKRKMTK